MNHRRRSAKFVGNESGCLGMISYLTGMVLMILILGFCLVAPELAVGIIEMFFETGN